MNASNDPSSAKGKKSAGTAKSAPRAKKPAAAKEPASKAREPASKPKAASKAKSSTATAKAASPVRRVTKPAAAPAATLVAEIDVGFGNQLYIRGSGAGLDWEHGLLMKCVGDAQWEWSGNTNSPITCKVVLNDTIWSQGEDIILTPGETKVIRPVF